ncbi:multicopper oxidase domain-containing protein [Cellulomonas sp. ICMP 17802]|uniref:multicopper oxidase domain-containing protein n=1 Tax=Cellulomonas sp. ICMP 17802 TaxID=3239199 RepID=UPI00351BBB01
MPAPLRTRITALVALVLALAGLTVAVPAASAAPVAVSLCAEAGSVTLPGEPAAVPIWGFGVATTPGDCSTATPSLPGPVLSVTEGDTVSISVVNALPPGTSGVPHTISFEAPGIAFDPGPTDAPVGGTVTRTFTAGAPGTYVYESGGDAGRQEAMGLYGALVVRPTTAGQAYDTAASAYDVEAVLVLSAVDPAFNAAPDTFDLHAYRATSWLIGGKPYPQTAPVIATAGQRVLLRYVNAGFDNSTMLLLGMHQQVLARDARLLAHPFDAAAETIPAGATEDTIATVPAGAPPSPNGFPLYNRQLHVTNGPQNATDPSPATGGGALTFIHP